MHAPAQKLACTLESSQLLDRMQAWQQVVSQATSLRIDDRRIIATYPNDAQLLRRLRELVGAEAACCSFLEFSLEERPDEIISELRFSEEMPAPIKELIRGVIGDDQ